MLMPSRCFAAFAYAATTGSLLRAWKVPAKDTLKRYGLVRYSRPSEASRPLCTGKPRVTMKCFSVSVFCYLYVVVTETLL